MFVRPHLFVNHPIFQISKQVWCSNREKKLKLKGGINSRTFVCTPFGPVREEKQSLRLKTL